MSEHLIGPLFVLIAAGAFFLGSMAHNRLAAQLLRIGGLTFGLSLALSVLAVNICQGSLRGGFAQCADSAVLGQIFTALAPVIQLGATAALLLGPLLLLVSLGLEIHSRYKADAA
ncbi:hypothetical protein [Pseudooceanicola sp. 200-1SW]|uniref:hypothetical protein n=1 Tax=Pseudooceanicola sp. 200-1SW TaxID=3425949 RepID=UPI003D7FE1DF